MVTLTTGVVGGGAEGKVGGNSVGVIDHGISSERPHLGIGTIETIERILPLEDHPIEEMGRRAIEIIAIGIQRLGG